MSEHTKGPWTADVTMNDRGGWESPKQQITIWSGETVIASYSTEFTEYPSDAENKANARLIAAVPELLAFAKAFEDSGMDSIGDIDVHELIAKATQP